MPIPPPFFNMLKNTYDPKIQYIQVKLSYSETHKIVTCPLNYSWKQLDTNDEPETIYQL